MKSILANIAILYLVLLTGCHESNLEEIPNSGVSYVLEFDQKLDDLSLDKLSVILLDFGALHNPSISMTETFSGNTLVRLDMPDKQIKDKKGHANLRKRLAEERFLFEFELRIIVSKD